MVDRVFKTSSDASYIHRFYDTDPVSPSGKYIALFRLPYEDKSPTYRDAGEVVVFEIQSGTEVFSRKTHAWDSQLGSQVQWGADDESLYFNDLCLDDFTVYGVRSNIFTGQDVNLSSSVYMVSSSGRYSVSPCLKRISRIQKGYGVRLPNDLVPENQGACSDDGIFIIDLTSGESRLLKSFADIVKDSPEVFEGLDLSTGAFYGFHTKWSPDERNLMFIMRWKSGASKHTKNFLVTFDREGKNQKVLVDSSRWIGGHHPNWAPDSKSIVMNLMYDNSSMNLGKITVYLEKLARKFGFRYFSNYKLLRISLIPLSGDGDYPYNNISFGSGHPSFHPSGHYVVTDCYPNERVANPDGTVPVRLLTRNYERSLINLLTLPKSPGRTDEWRIDPHPAFSRDGSLLTCNARNGDNRGVVVFSMDEVHV